MPFSMVHPENGVDQLAGGCAIGDLLEGRSVVVGDLVVEDLWVEATLRGLWDLIVRAGGVAGISRVFLVY